MHLLQKITLFPLILAAMFFRQAGAQTPPDELEGSWSITDSVIELRWNDPDVLPAPDYYNVYRKADGDASFGILDTAHDRRYDDAAVVHGTAYLYFVTAVYGGSGESTPTNTVTVIAGGDSGAGGGGGTLPPRDLVGLFDNSGAVELDWLAPDSGHSPSYYRIYRALAADSLFSAIGQAGELEFDDTSISENTSYLYFATAFYPDSFESVPSNTVQIQTLTFTDSSDDSSSGLVAFTSTPVLSAQIGQEYLYQAATMTVPAGVPVCYELRDAPAGMTVDSTGLVRWTPNALGLFEVELKARLCGPAEQEDGSQRFTVMVLSGDAGRIHGLVTDSSGTPLDSIRIKIFDVSSAVFVLKTRTGPDGTYEFSIVNPGTYFVRADADFAGFGDVWYEHSPELGGATPVVVPAGSNVTVNFWLSADAEDPAVLHPVSGTVRDTSGHPVPGATVTMVRLTHESGHDDFFDDDPHHEEHHGDDDHERRTTTDSAGAYRIEAPGGDYIVRGRASGYYEQFWDGRPTPLEATVLSLHHDTSGIDFSLVPTPGGLDGTGSITGVVRRAGSSTPVRAGVIGFMKDSHGRFTGYTSSDHTDTAGVYVLDELPAGFYVVMVKGDDGTVPAFYSLSGGTPFLDSASLVAVDGSPVTGIDIDVLTDSADGLNDISGHIEIEIETPGKNTPSLPNSIVPLAGAVVTVVDGAGAVVGSAVSGQDGMYTAPGLAPGEYTVVFQKPGAGTNAGTGTVAYQGGLPSSTTLNALLTTDAGPGPVVLFGVDPGWNLVSVPLTVADFSIASVFPTASSVAYEYTGSYRTTSILEAGRGYWLKFPIAQGIAAEGAAIFSGSYPLTKGWNIIGAISGPVPLSSVSTTPPALLTSGVYGYDGGYYGTATLEPGNAYWVKSSGDGTIHLTASGSAGSAVPGLAGAPAATSDRVTLRFTDGPGNSGTLTLERRPGLLGAELPPVPPGGAFDVRFSSGTHTERLPASGESATYGINIQHVADTTQLRITGIPDGLTIVVSDESGETIASSSSGMLRVGTGGASGINITVTNAGLPDQFTLHQNYPNPFNPTTTVRFDVPTASRVAMKVYDAIGRELAVLVDDVRPAGRHSAVWDASGYASGVYFVRIDAAAIDNPAVTIVQTRKMMLIR